MPPVYTAASVQDMIKKFVAGSRVAIFSKTTCPFCKEAKELLTRNNIKFEALELDNESTEKQNLIKTELKNQTNLATVPNIFINGQHFGDRSKLVALNEEKGLFKLVEGHNYDYDLVVIGGGSGGISAAKQAATLNRKVALLNYVDPTAIGTKWGLGGTCVNVGCVPKKLFHTAALLNESTTDSTSFGWRFNQDDMMDDSVNNKHDWSTLVQNVTMHIKKSNFGYRAQMTDKTIDYKNVTGKLLDKNTVECKDKSGNTNNITGKNILIAVGERPKYQPGVPNVEKYTITSDDLFSLRHNPGKTLVIGASYVALECAGFLNGLGYDTTVLVRSIFLRGFDQQMADMIGENMKQHGVKFIKPDTVDTIEELEAMENGVQPGLYKVTTKGGHVDEYNTIICALGREANLEKIGINSTKVESKKGKIVVDDLDKTAEDNIFALGDIALGRPELAPSAIQAGINFSNNLYTDSTKATDYVNVPTTVFTPLEYSSCGYSEEKAIEIYGQDKLTVFHRYFEPLEWTISQRENKGESCYMKIIVENETNIIRGMHYLGPNAGEVMQGFGVAMKMGMTKATLDDCIGIHPTNAEWFTSMTITKDSGDDIKGENC